MRFLDLLPAERVRSGLVAHDKAELIDRLATLLASGDDVAVVRDALSARERLGTTGLGRGVAIPHGRSAAVREARAAFVRLATPISFGADDGLPVDLVAALIVPAHFTDQHLTLLAELAELFSDTRVTAALRAAPDDGTLRAELARARGVSLQG
ncbi:MAG: PTS transporter subunit EIIA [Rhodanobacteraceae bacterium]|jgi:PTS system nitrogen regulatory IIA component|nr:PTS transporter subunit EIIA [Rhodanobacteraceae bacterium]